MIRTVITGKKAFVGRHDVLQALYRALDDTVEEGMVRCVVSGETGIGRTALLGAFLSGCRARGVPVMESADQTRAERGPRVPAGCFHSPALVAGSSLTGRGTSLIGVAGDPHAPVPVGPKGALVAALRGREPAVLMVDDANCAGAVRLQRRARAADHLAARTCAR